MALALPESDAETVLIDMSDGERGIYPESISVRGPDLKDLIRRASRPATWVVEMAISARRAACAGVDPRGISSLCAKLEWLLDDLAALRSEEPAMHTVVFTHFKESYHRIHARLVRAGYTVCGFQGNCQPLVRQATIREFQASIGQAQAGRAKETKAKIFLATTKVGNVGITLTAATRVCTPPCVSNCRQLSASPHASLDLPARPSVHHRSVRALS